MADIDVLAQAAAAASTPVPGARLVAVQAGSVVSLDAASVVATTLRNVATRASICNSFNGANKQTMSRSRHITRSPITSLKLLFGNWRCDLAAGEVGSGAATTYTASIEYPAGTFTQVKFGGATSIAVADLGEVISDDVIVAIPNNAQFWVRTWTNNSAGILYIGKPEATSFGEAMEFGATTPDKTMAGTLTAGGAGIVTPYAILAQSSRPSVFAWGDSRVLGQSDSYTGCVSNDQGILARSIGPSMAYINCGIPADRTEVIKTSYAKRVSLATRFCTDAVVALGINDINQYSRTAAAVYPELQTLWAAVAPLSVFACTLNPVSTSTDAYATTANQTTSSVNAQRVLLNNMIRESISVGGVFDMADVVETARDSGIWKAPGYTSDGLHENQKAAVVIANSRAMDLGRLA